MLACAFSYREFKQANVDLIYLDPGHGGIDGGCISNDGVYEKDIVLDISYKVKEYLEFNGYRVLMTRTSDYDLADDGSTNRKHDDILKRVDYINDSNAKVCVSIHANSYPSKIVKGAQVFYGYGSAESENLSNAIQENIKSVLKNTDRVALKIKEKYILDNVKCPISIVEVGFLSNTEESKNLQDEAYQLQIAYAIGEGIVQFLNVRSE